LSNFKKQRKLKTLIKNATIVNEGRLFIGHLLIDGQYIAKLSETEINTPADNVVDAKGLFLFPGVIDDQVHFREPGLTHKAEIYTEAKAAVAGGVTSYMEMPNTVPNTLTQTLLEEKYKLAAEKSLANFSFYMGVSNTNIDEVLKTNPQNVCGIKIFMGSSTGNMLVDDKQTLETIFAKSKLLIATHCEDETAIKTNTEKYNAMYADALTPEHHPLIRDAEACYQSSSLAVTLAKKHGTRLHVLHISTAKELALFDNTIPLSQKRITAEACIHHLWFTDKDYKTKGNFIKWNPAVKTVNDRAAILQAVLENKIDVIATDHAPHTKEEKMQHYTKAPSGGPLVQHALVAMLDLYHDKKITLEKIAEKMSHAVADCFAIKNRGYLREGYFADMVLVDLNAPQTVSGETVLYKCKWSPFEGHTFRSSVKHTFVSGHHAYNNGTFDETKKGERLLFNR
jgi:dihydroorotase